MTLVTGCSQKTTEPTVQAEPKKEEVAPVIPTAPNPPYNDFNPKSQVTKKTATRFAEGVVTGTIVGSVLSSPAPVLGGIIGGTVGGTYTYMTAGKTESKEHLIYALESQDRVQVVQERGKITLLVPTDFYYTYDTYELAETAYVGLQHIAQLVYLYSGDATVYIAGFSDGGIGSSQERQKISKLRAQYMADFLWANGVPLNRLMVAGYGERYDIADNYLIHGAAMNRRVEIQWKMPTP